MRNRFKLGGRHLQIDQVERNPPKFVITENDEERELTLPLEPKAGQGRVVVGGRARPYYVTATAAGTWVSLAGNTFYFEKSKGEQGQDETHGGFGAPMPGKVLKVAVAAGDKVSKGDVLAIMEAMKMEHRIEAPADGVVTEVHCAEGDLIDQGFELIDFEASED